MTPSSSPTDTSRVSFEAADRPNYFLSAGAGGRVSLSKWEEGEAFREGATFVLHRNTWSPGYDALESHARPGFFLHATPARLHLLKYRHADSFRKATLFRLTGILRSAQVLFVLDAAPPPPSPLLPPESQGSCVFIRQAPARTPCRVLGVSGRTIPAWCPASRPAATRRLRPAPASRSETFDL